MKDVMTTFLWTYAKLAVFSNLQDQSLDAKRVRSDVVAIVGVCVCVTGEALSGVKNDCMQPP